MVENGDSGVSHGRWVAFWFRKPCARVCVCEGMLHRFVGIAILLASAPLLAAVPTTRPAAPATAPVIAPAPALTPIARFVESEFCPADRGHYFTTEWGLPLTNLWAVPAYFGRELIAIAAALIGLPVARRTLRLMRRRWIIGQPHCRRCGYCLFNLASDRCPECGIQLTGRTRVIARPVGRRVALGMTVAMMLFLAYPAMYIAHAGRAVHPLWPRPRWSLRLGDYLDRHLGKTPAGRALVLHGSRIVEKDIGGNIVRAFEPLPIRILFSFEQADAGSLMVHIDAYGPEYRYIDPAAPEAIARDWGVYQWARWDPATGKLSAHRTFGFDANAWSDGRRVYLIPTPPSPVYAPRELEAPAWRCYDATTGENLPPPAWLAESPLRACLPDRSTFAFTLDWKGRNVRTYDKATGQIAAEFTILTPHAGERVDQFALERDGRLMLLKYCESAPELYELTSGRLLRKFDQETFEGESRDLTLYGLSAPGDADGTFSIEIRAFRTDRLVATMAGSGPRRHVELRFSPDERHLYCRGLNWANTEQWAVFDLGERTTLKKNLAGN